MKLEDTSQSDIELGEDDKPNLVPTYHWSEILNPRCKDVTDLLTGSVTITQKVNPKGTTAKTTAPKPACVIYDEAFIQYLLLEVIAPFICGAKNAKFENEEPTLNEVVEVQTQLVNLLVKTLENSVKHHDNAIDLCGKMGIELSYEPKLMLRSFKLAVAESRKNEKFLDSLDD